LIGGVHKVNKYCNERGKSCR